MILIINTSDKDTVTVSLKNSDKVIQTLSEKNLRGSEALLPLINKILELERLEVGNLTEIEVATGPGSFTGIRVGVSVANAMGFALNIPVNGKKMETAISY